MIIKRLVQGLLLGTAVMSTVASPSWAVSPFDVGDGKKAKAIRSVPHERTATQTRIVGGDDVDVSEYNDKWQSIVALKMKVVNPLDGQYCGGTLIAPNLVATAAHCVHDPFIGLIEERAGVASEIVANIRVLSNTAGSEELAISEVYIHPMYDPYTADYDVAVLRLATNSASPSMVLNTTGALTGNGMPAHIAGWGMLSEISQRLPDRLMQADVPVVENSICDDEYAPFFGAGAITSRMMCAGTLDTDPGFSSNGVDSCYGDSGGPLIVDAGANYKLAGITSWGMECASDATRGVYTRVSAVAPWLASINPAGGGPGGVTAAQGLMQTARGSTWVDLDWSQPVSGAPAGGYQVDEVYDFEGMQFLFPMMYKPVATSGRVQSLAPLTTYKFMVRGLSADGSKGDASNVISVTTRADIARPTRPGRPRLQKRYRHSLSIKYVPATDNHRVDKYIIQRKTSRGWRTVAKTTKLSHRVKGLKPGRVYALRVIAQDASGNRSLASKASRIRTRS